LGKRRVAPTILPNLEVIKFAAEGNCIAKHEEQIVFLPFAAPGDVVDAQIIKKKKNFLQAKPIVFHLKSALRVEPKCKYFGVCGGCKWQHIAYENQLQLKEQQVKDNFEKIGKVTPFEYLPIIGADKIYAYRNKFEFSFSISGWIEKIEDKTIEKKPALGFHIPGRFDKILDIDYCHLANETINEICRFVYEESYKRAIPFYDQVNNKGILRNLIIRTSSTGGLMVILVTSELTDEVKEVLQAVQEEFNQITSLNFIINTKMNDTIFDLDVVCIHGEPNLYDVIGKVKFKIRPKSFFQTNSYQVNKLYECAIEMAALKPTDVVYDLYTGTGSIALSFAKAVKKVVGIEILPQAIEDAKENATLNGITNCQFFVGDMKKAFTIDLINQQGNPDVIITDPPRNGMDEEVVNLILTIAPEKVVYISCNPATQARDLHLLSAKYNVQTSRAVDMFPHTHHVENVALLVKR